MCIVHCALSVVSIDTKQAVVFLHLQDGIDIPRGVFFFLCKQETCNAMHGVEV